MYEHQTKSGTKSVMFSFLFLSDYLQFFDSLYYLENRESLLINEAEIYEFLTWQSSGQKWHWKSISNEYEYIAEYCNSIIKGISTIRCSVCLQQFISFVSLSHRASSSHVQLCYHDWVLRFDGVACLQSLYCELLVLCQKFVYIFSIFVFLL